MSNPSYSRVNWEDSPSTNTPINAENLNKMDKGISDCATAIATKQESTDNNLTTTDKTIRGAINEINADLSNKLYSELIIPISFVNGNGVSVTPNRWNTIYTITNYSDRRNQYGVVLIGGVQNKFYSVPCLINTSGAVQVYPPEGTSSVYQMYGLIYKVIS